MLALRSELGIILAFFHVCHSFIGDIYFTILLVRVTLYCVVIKPVYIDSA